MKNETFYRALKDLTNNFKSSAIDFSKLIDLKTKLEIEITAEENKTTTSKTRIKKLFNYFKKLKRQILNGYTTQIDGFKTFTDSYYLVSLKDIDFNGLHFENKTKDYPNIKNICDRIYNNYMYYKYKINININDLLNQIKIAKNSKKDKNADITTSIIKLNCDNKKIVAFGCDVLTNFIISLNLKPNDNIILYGSNEIQPFYTENKNGSKGFILPVVL